MHLEQFFMIFVRMHLTHLMQLALIPVLTQRTPQTETLTMNEEKDAYEKGRASAEDGGNHNDNTYRYGSREWFACEEGRADGGAKDVGPAPGCPAWA